MRRRRLVLGACTVAPTLLLASTLGGCGFQLRQAPSFAFSSLYMGTGSTTALANELRRNLQSAGTVQVLGAPVAPTTAEVVLDLVSELRQKVVVGLSASGQVREFQLRTILRFRLRTPQGRELIPETELRQQRDISYSESAALAKEAEEALLYRDMQTDLVQQLLRRLAAVKAV